MEVTLLFLTLALSSPRAHAQAPRPIHSGEFRNTAQTTEKGTFVLHPFLRSHYGISDNVDIKFSIPGQLFGPSAFVEVGLVDTPGFALSVEPYARVSWLMRPLALGGDVRTTLGLRQHRLNLSVGTSRVLLPIVDAGGDRDYAVSVSVPVGAGLDLPTSESSVFRFVLNADAYQLFGDTPVALVGANYSTRIGEDFTLQVGAAAFVGQSPFGDADLEEELGFAFPAILPLPTFEIWWAL